LRSRGNAVDGLVSPIGGVFCGFLAGFAAQYGRLCTVGAIEDAVIAGDYRRAAAWAVSAALAIVFTQSLVFAGGLDLTATQYAQPRLELVAGIVGGVLFGIGAAMVGTCAFGLLVRLGTGDLRALICALILGMAAFSATGGVLSPIRVGLTEIGAFDTAALGGNTLTGIVDARFGTIGGFLSALLVASALVAFAVTNQRLYPKRRLIVAACLMGCAIGGGWVVTGVVADPFEAQRPESLTFVAPLGRVILQLMGEAFSNTGFAGATLFGVAAGSFTVAAVRQELRWEAFDDQREMRRHLLGAVLMGIGGVLARGCTIGQGLSGASALSIATPVVVLAMVAGAWLALAHLIEGRPLFARWR
jgi:uncharacterized membrane protein YedE/YeeE